MAPELDMGMSMGMGMGVGLEMGMMPMGMASMEAAAASSSFSTAYMCGLPSADAMRVDDLLDFSHQDDLFDAAAGQESYQPHLLPLHEPPAAAGSLVASAPHLSTFSDDLYIPSEEAAELEWLSKFVDDSFSDVPFLPSHGVTVSSAEPVLSSNSSVLGADPSGVPARARSKRSRAPATALHHTISTWCSPPPLQPQSSTSTTSSASSSSSSSEFPPGGASSKPSKAAAAAGSRKVKEASVAGVDGGVRRCTHCSSEKTPQWRTGPLGPKTLCNACGVRYKSGRLVPEYRPAASPTFVLTHHSNSHRKVMELRRQKELLLRQHAGAAPSAPSMSPSPRPELLFRDYEVC